MTAIRRWLKGATTSLLGILLVTTGLGSVDHAHAIPIAIPGTSISLEIPDGFTVADNFSGLENIRSGSSVTINELPLEAYEEIFPLFSSEDAATEGLLRQGITIEDYSTLAVGDDQVPLLRGTQQSAVGVVTKYLTLFKGETTILVTFNILDPDDLTQEKVETTIASITLAAAPTLDDKLAQLPFSFQPASPFTVADVMGGSLALLSTIPGPDPTGLLPIVIIARGQNVIYGRDAADLSEDLLRGTQGFALAEIVLEEAVEFAGGSGYFIQARMDDLTVIQYTHVPENGRYIRLLATTAHEGHDDVRFAIEEIADSVRVKD